MAIPSTHPIHRVYALLGHFRAKRMQRFLETFPISPETRLLDIGGAMGTWSGVSVRPRLTLLNVYPRPEGIPDDVTWIEGDARTLPFGPTDFDLVFSNSVIEHVGDLGDQQAFANEVLRLETPYWIQTPNYGFPIEPHYLGLGVQFLPRAWQAGYARVASLRGLMGGREAVQEIFTTTRLLTPRDMRHLFPDARIWRERFLGLTKSIVAYRAQSSATDGSLKMAPATATH